MGVVNSLSSEIERCAKCGQCRTVCPIFSALKDEKFVARGRLSLLQADQSLKNKYRIFERIINTCLLCLRCENNCPSRVKTGEIFKYERVKLAKERGLPALLSFAFRWVLPKRWFYNLVLRLGSWVRPLRIANCPAWAGRIANRHPPLYFANLLQQIPEIAPQSALEIIGARGHAKGRAPPLGRGSPSRLAFATAKRAGDAFGGQTTSASSAQGGLRWGRCHKPSLPSRQGRTKVGEAVGIFIGCATNYFYPDIIKSLVSILEDLNIPYEIPPQQVCCGMPVLLSGDEQTARRLMRKNRECLKYRTVITVCPSCNRMLSDSLSLPVLMVPPSCPSPDGHRDRGIRTNPVLTGSRRDRDKGSLQAENIDPAVKVIDAVEFLDSVTKLSPGGKTSINPVRDRSPSGDRHSGINSNYTLAKGQISNSSNESKNISNGVNTIYHKPCHSDGTRAPDIIMAFLKAGTQYTQIEDICCGGGGLFTFKYPDLSHQIGQYRLKSINQFQAGRRYIITNCPGCIMQLEYLLKVTKTDNLKVSHFLNFYTMRLLKNPFCLLFLVTQSVILNLVQNLIRP
ncbi:MAG: (Fe-S)-binding protein [Planctomycetota bacterium]|nr:(Fe-S)-binding protein [Planctomycetota bacterium]MDI6787507.1 (Fe-S)-binding protein [Planctomycetota bacterium]